MSQPTKTLKFYKKGNPKEFPILCQHRPIFPGRRQPSIVGTVELNCRVRNGNGWTLNVNITDFSAPSGIRTPAMHRVPSD